MTPDEIGGALALGLFAGWMGASALRAGLARIRERSTAMSGSGSTRYAGSGTGRSRKGQRIPHNKGGQR